MHASTRCQLTNYQLTALPLVTSIYGTSAACVPAASSFRLNDIESSHSLLREHVHVPPSPPGFLWQERLSNLGQWWQQRPPRQGGCEPGSHLASQPARQPSAAVEPQQLPGGAHYTGEISNHESFTPVLPSLPLSPTPCT